ncbi:VOC family protein [Streptomyces sp. AC536]|uniref:VOC family protein n=1 Tax=Streptomyces buecherae TaxID=2763006 RepID=UPI00164E3882|nr:VOC family protein [Streptomyces buecherae]MBC3985675.1 VOC family protein [Streptomyces buecherae]QNJ40739.1 VOC family protein [Streptomyces buecherae]
MQQTPLAWKVVVDAEDPHRQATFWAAALRYRTEDNGALIERLLAAGAVGEQETVEFQGRRAWRDLVAVRHPDDPFDPGSDTGLGRRILFQRVPEPKATKNRLHLDLHSAPGERDEEIARLEELGATSLHRVSLGGIEWQVMTDPEGNEYCLH